MCRQSHGIYFLLQFVVFHIACQELSLENVTLLEQDITHELNWLYEPVKFKNQIKPTKDNFEANSKRNVSSIKNNTKYTMDEFWSPVNSSVFIKEKWINSEIFPVKIQDGRMIQSESSLTSSETYTISENNTYMKNYMKILYHEFKYDNCLIIPFDDTWLNWVLQMPTMKTVIYPEFMIKLKATLRKFDAYVGIIATVQDLKHVLRMLHGTPNWSYRAKYLLIYLGDPRDLIEIFTITWTYFLLDLSVLTIHGRILEVYTHYPYANGSCGTNLFPVKLDEFTGIFPEKVGLHLKGCEIRLMGLNINPYVLDVTKPKDQPTKAGLEVTVIHNVLRRMNVTDIYVANTYADWGYMLPDGNFTMTFKALHDRQVDIIFGMIIGNETMEKYFDTTVAHIDTAGVWFVPTASQIAQWKNLTVIFDGTVWSAILVVFLLNAFAWWILGRNREKSPSYNELSLCFMGALYILLQGSFPTAKTWKIRFVVLIWSMASLLIFTAHQCHLTGILTSPLYQHQISNLRELVDSGLNYGFYPILKDLYTDPTNWVHAKILHNFQSCSLTTECMNRTAFNRDFALIKNKRQGEFLMPIYYAFPSGKPKLYTFKEPEFVAWCKYYVSRGFPLLKRINQLIMLLLASGLVAKWDADLTPRVQGDDEAVLEALTLDHLQAAFYLLVFGYIIACCMLMSEKIYKRFWDKDEVRANVTQDSGIEYENNVVYIT